MKYFSHFCIIVSCFLLLTGCVKKKEHVEEKSDMEIDGNVIEEGQREEVRMSDGTIYEALNRDNEGLKIVEDALRTTGLDTMLAQGGPYTFFAPSDKAFEEMRIFTEKRLPDSIDQEELKRLLMHHVAEGNYSAADLANMSSVVTLDGDSLHVIKVDNQVTIDSALLIFPDRDEAVNGFIHVINEVLVPENQASN